MNLSVYSIPRRQNEMDQITNTEASVLEIYVSNTEMVYLSPLLPALFISHHVVINHGCLCDVGKMKRRRVSFRHIQVFVCLILWFAFNELVPNFIEFNMQLRLDHEWLGWSTDFTWVPLHPCFWIINDTILIRELWKYVLIKIFIDDIVYKKNKK